MQELINTKNEVIAKYKDYFQVSTLHRHLLRTDIQQMYLRGISHLKTVWLIVILNPHLIGSSGDSENLPQSQIFKKYVFAVLRLFFKKMYLQNPSSEQGDDDMSVSDSNIDEEAKKSLHKFSRHVENLGLVDSIMDVLSTIILEEIRIHLADTYEGDFSTEGQLQNMKDWVDKHCIAFAKDVLLLELAEGDLDEPAVEDSEESIITDLREDDLETMSIGSLDSDASDRFEMVYGSKTVSDMFPIMMDIGYPVKDPTSSIKKPYGRPFDIQKGGILKYYDEDDDEVNDHYNDDHGSPKSYDSSPGELHGPTPIMKPKSNLLSTSTSDLTATPQWPNTTSSAITDSTMMNIGSTTFFEEAETKYPPSSPLRTSAGNQSPIRLHSRSFESIPLPGDLAESPFHSSSGGSSAVGSPVRRFSSDNTYDAIPTSLFVHLGDLERDHFPTSQAQIRQGKINLLKNWKSQLQMFVVENYGRMRMNEMFSLIVDYPDSLPALKDLAECLSQTQQYGDLVTSLRSSFSRRLLHPGATTADIVATYISSIRSLKEIDPSLVLINHVSVDVREYLRNRPDSLKSIVMLLTEEGGENGISLLSELEESVSQQQSNSNGDDDIYGVDHEDGGIGTGVKGDFREERWFKWNPNPIISQPGNEIYYHSSSSHHIQQQPSTRDIISILVSIHGSKEYFVQEYASLLCSKLISKTDFVIDQEVKHVELLKLKFGETVMQPCEIMLKDINESKRTNTAIQKSIKAAQQQGDDSMESEEVDDGCQLSTAIISYNYWPSNLVPMELRNLPSQIQSHRAAFTKAYGTLKGRRSLVWYDSLGTVDIDLEFPTRSPAVDENSMDIDDQEEPPYSTHSFSVTPIQAASILKFDQQTIWTVDNLSRELGAPEESLKRSLQFWKANGVLQEKHANEFEIVNYIDTNETIADVEIEDEQVEEAGQSDEEIGQYVVAMLKNLGTLPINRIHQMMSNVSPDYDRTLQQLEEILGRMVDAEQIAGTKSSREYSLIKKK